MFHLTIISDDLTGCVDTGAILLCSGCSVDVAVKPDGNFSPHKEGQVISINMSSRTLRGEDSKKRHEMAAAKIKDFPNQVVMKKFDTAFRGSVGFETEGLFGQLKNDLCFVVSNSLGRNNYTLHGHQYVGGTLLDQSYVSKEDPLKRQTRSYVPDIIASETDLPVGTVDIDAVRNGSAADEVRGLEKRGCKIIVFDAVTKEDDYRIVSSIQPLYPGALWAGSVGLAWGLAKTLYREPVFEPVPAASSEGHVRCVCFTASAMSTTKEQIKVAQSKAGLEVVVLDIDRYILQDLSVLSDTVEECVRVNAEKDFILVPRISEEHEKAGVDKVILEAMSYCAMKICSRSNFDRLVIIGGETAQAILDKLEVSSLRVTERVEDSVGAGVILDGPYKGKQFAFKGGVCGTPDGLCKMVGKF